jgi:hypothetical protein
MKRRHVLVLVVVTLASIIIWDIFHTNNKTQYNEQLIKMRAEKDLYFKSAKNSPVFGDSSFTRLHYYSPNPEYKLRASYVKDTLHGVPLRLKMTDGIDEQFVHAGVFQFKLNGASYQLRAFQSLRDKSKEKVFVPFADATSGQTTYGGGRYLDVTIDGSTATLDFNLCYHPYCAYNSTYVCPVPPKENILPIPIEAGERLR